MVLYRRNFVPGGTFFFTVTLRDRRADTLVREIAVLREAFARTMAVRPFALDAMVVLPDHLHVVMTLPDGDANYSGRWRAIKSTFVRGLRKRGATIAQNARGEVMLWQARFWEHTIRNDDDLRRHVDYIHFNPVKHGLVERPTDWPHSSIHRYIADGRLVAAWGTNEVPPDA